MSLKSILARTREAFNMKLADIEEGDEVTIRGRVVRIISKSERPIGFIPLNDPGGWPCWLSKDSINAIVARVPKPSENDELRHWKSVAESYQKQMPKIRDLEEKVATLELKIKTLEASRKELKRLIDDVSLELESDDE